MASVAQDGVPRFKDRALWRRIQEWAHTSGFEFQRMCIFVYPPGEGRTYRLDASGRIVWIDRSRAETPWK